MSARTQDWPRAYEAVARSLAGLSRSARLTLAGFCACIDHTHSLHTVAPALLADIDPQAVALGTELRRRAGAGIGGELCIAWPNGPDWFARHGCAPASLGGTAAQAANALAMLGAEVLLALHDRHARQLALIHPTVLVATADGPMPVRTLVPAEAPGKPPHIVLEYERGRDLGGIAPPRSTRVILRFAEDGLDQDAVFEALSIDMAPAAGAGILAGFNAVPIAQAEAELGRTMDLARRWRGAGVDPVHVELADYPDPRVRAATLSALRGAATSVGMNVNELRQLAPRGDMPGTKAMTLATALGVSRLTVHADDWAFSLTRQDPDRERLALMVGCLLAATRAAAGRPAVPEAHPCGAVYHQPPSAPPELPAGWHYIACPAPYLPQPRSTIGLGDTFLAGTMLVLGQAGWPANLLQPEDNHELSCP